jgi:hypothetical protein
MPILDGDGIRQGTYTYAVTEMKIGETTGPGGGQTP